MKELAMFYNFSDERLRKAKFALMPLKIQVKKVEKKISISLSVSLQASRALSLWQKSLTVTALMKK